MELYATSTLQFGIAQQMGRLHVDVAVSCAAGHHSRSQPLVQPTATRQLPQQPTATLQLRTAGLLATWPLPQHQALLLLPLILCWLALVATACCSASS
jgi:hypothetical protein